MLRAGFSLSAGSALVFADSEAVFKKLAFIGDKFYSFLLSEDRVSSDDMY